MIVVTGATGKLGSQIVDALLTHVPADRVGVSVRDVDAAAGLAERGVRVRRGDFTDPGSLVDAFEGADQVLVVSASIRGPGAQQANVAAIDAAVAAGALRVLYTSHQASSATSAFAPQPQHAATEQHLAGRDVPYVSLRNGFYASALAMYLGQARSDGVIRAPQDGPVSWTAHADLAAAAATALVDPDALEGVSPPLTAGESLDLTAVAEIASDVLGRHVERVVLTDDEWVQEAVAAGLPAPAADFALGMFVAARNGEFDVVDPTLERLIGRPPTPARATVEHLLA